MQENNFLSDQDGESLFERLLRIDNAEKEKSEEAANKSIEYDQEKVEKANTTDKQVDAYLRQKDNSSHLEVVEEEISSIRTAVDGDEIDDNETLAESNDDNAEFISSQHTSTEVQENESEPNTVSTETMVARYDIPTEEQAIANQERARKVLFVDKNVENKTIESQEIDASVIKSSMAALENRKASNRLEKESNAKDVAGDRLVQQFDPEAETSEKQIHRKDKETLPKHLRELRQEEMKIAPSNKESSSRQSMSNYSLGGDRNITQIRDGDIGHHPLEINVHLPRQQASSLGMSASSTGSSLTALTQLRDLLLGDLGATIAKNMSIQLSEMQKGNINLVLHPREFGEVHIALVMKEKSVVGRVWVDNSDVQQVIRDNIESLEQSFLQKGIDLQSLDVFLRDEQSEQNFKELFHPSSQGAGYEAEQTHGFVQEIDVVNSSLVNVLI